MGRCGCSEIPADWTLPGPNGSVYTIHLHVPCTYCENPGGVALSHLTTPDDVLMFAAGATELKLDNGIGVGIPVLDLAALRGLIGGQCSGMLDELEDIESDGELAEALCDDLDRNAAQMVSETFQKFKKAVRS